ncbi:DUF7345 domain-containing protein [Halomicrobium salinisoli]|uniref:DUF7345 domain-containing protein n=1 Tax=Halomicrobium salinisoli TaxID=2878391 RepID=UPI001CF021F0|nr:PGF-CTERM sorting domain-containing protein [Halomicrobium salinisoli]
MRRTGRTLLIGAVALLTVAAAVPAPAAAQDPEPAFVVDLAESGDAAVSVTYAFDLDTDAERQAFRELRDNESAREAYAARFGDRLRSVAANAENASGREMAVEDVTIDVATDDRTGVVTLSADWRGLAATTDGGLAVTEPFASGFAPDRQFVIALPDGYEASEVAPEPASSGDGRLTWSAGTDLDGFELVAAESGGGDAATADGDRSTAADGPGFGVAAALAGLVAAALLARRRA